MSKTTQAEKANEKKLAKVGTTPTGLPELEQGWVWHDLRNSKGVYAGGSPNLYSFTEPMWVAIPVSPEAQAGVLLKYATPLKTPDGEIALDGVQGVVARQMVQNYETVRGRWVEIAEKGGEVTHPMIQADMFKHELFGGKKGGIKQVLVSEDTVARLIAKGDAAEIMAYLKQQGAKVM